jgi:hypothetical protein
MTLNNRHLFTFHNIVMSCHAQDLSHLATSIANRILDLTLRSLCTTNLTNSCIVHAGRLDPKVSNPQSLGVDQFSVEPNRAPLGSQCHVRFEIEMCRIKSSV